MSGGSMNYLYYQVADAAYEFDDPEIKEMLIDVSALLHDKEWYDSGDTCEGAYNKTLKEFKDKWLRKNAVDRLKPIIDDRINKVQEELYKCIGISQYCSNCFWWDNVQDTKDYGTCVYSKGCLKHSYDDTCEHFKSQEVNND